MTVDFPPEDQDPLETLDLDRPVAIAAMDLAAIAGLEWPDLDDKIKARFIVTAEMFVKEIAPYIAHQAWNQGNAVGYLQIPRDNPYPAPTDPPRAS